MTRTDECMKVGKKRNLHFGDNSNKLVQNEYKTISLMAHRPEWMAAVICLVAWIAYAATYRLNILRCIKTVGNVDGVT